MHTIRPSSSITRSANISISKMTAVWHGTFALTSAQSVCRGIVKSANTHTMCQGFAAEKGWKYGCTVISHFECIEMQICCRNFVEKKKTYIYFIYNSIVNSFLLAFAVCLQNERIQCGTKTRRTPFCSTEQRMTAARIVLMECTWIGIRMAELRCLRCATHSLLFVRYSHPFHTFEVRSVTSFHHFLFTFFLLHKSYEPHKFSISIHFALARATTTTMATEAKKQNVNKHMHGATQTIPTRN